MDTAVTREVEVSVESFFLESESNPEQNRYSFAYRVQLKNLGRETVQLLSRHWIITDSIGKVQHVKGPGVVGEQPVLKPGASYEYTSGSRLESPMGTMEGTYQMVTDEGENFDIRIPMFTLAVPGTLN
ncbi:MAG: Co2+/Mg2+ efflux protein ApaG [SAR324 cluster bacterium]|nr:Co2+/Mg2+ efflux protein ApaG [SAR324 cluster bacterium]